VAQGGEDILLDEFDSLGLSCDPHTQLVVTCEVCRRPATKECWTCKMMICEFCTLKRHWKDGFPLHWPLINSDHMREKLAKRELESKKKEDARLTDRAHPHYRTENELKDIRAFKDAAYQLMALPKDERLRMFDGRLARFYMWAQTDEKIIIACKIPTGYSDMELVVNIAGNVLEVQAENSPPLIERMLAEPIDTSAPVESIRSEDNTVCILAIQKHEWKYHWKSLFEGDSHGARCLSPPYEQYDGVDDVVLSLEVPFWIDMEDVKVDISDIGIDIEVRNQVRVKRTFWRNAEEEARSDEYRVVDVDACSWQLEDDIGGDGERCKLLSINLIRPPLTEDEIQWKRGVRQDNRQGKRTRMAGYTGQQRGYRFFVEDEDDHGLEDYLQAMCLFHSGKTWVPSKPWESDSVDGGRWASSSQEVGAKALELLARLSALMETKTAS
jgi:HSP20 family molecular chaperone IbpA